MFAAPRSRRTSAFTLIELAVVVAIIAVVAMIAIPTFMNIRHRAASRSAQSDLISARTQALSFYIHNNDNFESAEAVKAAHDDWVSSVDTVLVPSAHIICLETDKNDQTWTLIHIGRGENLGSWFGNAAASTWCDESDAAATATAIAGGIADGSLFAPGTNGSSAEASPGGDDSPSGPVLDPNAYLANGPFPLGNFDTGVSFDSLGVTDEFTLAMSVTFLDEAGTDELIMEHQQGATVIIYNGLMAVHDGQAEDLVIAEFAPASGAPLGFSEPTHLAMTVDSSGEVRFYVDGQAITPVGETNLGPGYTGFPADTATFKLNGFSDLGVVENIYISAEALDEANIQALANMGSGATEAFGVWNHYLINGPLTFNGAAGQAVDTGINLVDVMTPVSSSPSGAGVLRLQMSVADLSPSGFSPVLTHSPGVLQEGHVFLPELSIGVENGTVKATVAVSAPQDFSSDEPFEVTLVGPALSTNTIYDVAVKFRADYNAHSSCDAVLYIDGVEVDSGQMSPEFNACMFYGDGMGNLILGDTSTGTPFKGTIYQFSTSPFFDAAP